MHDGCKSVRLCVTQSKEEADAWMTKTSVCVSFVIGDGQKFLIFVMETDLRSSSNIGFSLLFCLFFPPFIYVVQICARLAQSIASLKGEVSPLQSTKW